MKKFITTIVLLVVINIAAFSQLESYAILSKDQRSAIDINLFAYKSIGKKWNINCFTLMETSPASPTEQTSVWAEIMPGVDYTAGKWNFGLEVGLETNGKARIGNWIFFSGKKDQFSISLEKGNGTDNHWYSLEYQHTFAKVFNLGLMARRWTVLGPEIGFTIHGKKEAALFKPTFFAVAGVDPESYGTKRAIAGITIPIQ